MAYTYELDATVPATTDLVSQGPTVFHNIQAALLERIGTMFTGVDVDPWVLNGKVASTSDGTFNGVTIGRGANAVAGNVLVGGAGTGITTGGNNTVFGTGAGAAITTGANNVMLGANAGKYETGGGTFYLDAFDRGSLSAGRTAALMYGTFNVSAGLQTLAINAQVSLAQGLSLGPATLAPTLVDVWSFEYPAMRYYVGDGSGYGFALSKRTGGVTTDLVYLDDRGSLTVTADIYVGGSYNFFTNASNGYWASGYANFAVGWYNSGGIMIFRTNTTNALTINVAGRTDALLGLQVGGAATLLAAEIGLFSFETPVMRYYVGTGVGTYSLTFAARNASATTDLVTISDLGTLTMKKGFLSAAFGGALGTAVATNAASPFAYIGTMTGAPTGTPVAISGCVPIVYDTTNRKLWAYDGATWRYTQLT